MIRWTLILVLLTTFSPLCSQVSSCGSDLGRFAADDLEKLPDLYLPSLSPQPKGSNPDTVAITIHIIESGAENQLLNLETIEKEMAAVNEFFSQANLFFLRCGPIRTIKGENAYDFTSGDRLNRQHHVPNTINLYFSEWLQSDEGIPICGYSGFPWMGRASDRYIMMANPCLDNGVTLAHEFGHFYGLYHTHETYFGKELVDGSNCDFAGDMICDTSADPNLNYAYITNECDYRGSHKDPLGKAYSPPVSNLMSYAPTHCRLEFSNLQNALMRSVHERENAFLYGNCDFYPDFTISFNLESIITIGSGDPILASYTFNNIGVNQNYDLDLHFTIAETPDAQGTLIRKEILSVRPDQTNIQRKFIIDFPGNRGSGQYYLIAKIDAYNKVIEREEENNATVLSVKVDNSSLSSNAVLFPNPVREELSFFLRDKDMTGLMNIHIFRYNGQLVRTFPSVEKGDEEVLQRITVADLPPGIYLLSVDFETERKPYTFSFLKE